MRYIRKIIPRVLTMFCIGTNYRCLWTGPNTHNFPKYDFLKELLLETSSVHSWIQSLMRNKNFLPCSNNGGDALHQGPLIRTNSRAPTCNVSGLKCAVCLYAKASAQTPSNLPLRQSPKKMMLKIDNLTPGSCVSADHYFSPIQGCLPHSFG